MCVLREKNRYPIKKVCLHFTNESLSEIQKWVQIIHDVWPSIQSGCKMANGRLDGKLKKKKTISVHFWTGFFFLVRL